jgi:hypothetical protein
MTSFLDALQDIKDTQRIIGASKAGGLFGALDAHQKMRERQQLRDLSAAAQESVDLQRKLLEQQKRYSSPPAAPTTFSRSPVTKSRSTDPDVVISLLEEIVTTFPEAMQNASRLGTKTVAANIALWKGFDLRRKTEADKNQERQLQKELETLEARWSKPKTVQQQITSLRSKIVSLQAKYLKEHPDYLDMDWGGFRDQVVRDFPEVCEHYGFTPQVQAARAVYACHYIFTEIAERITSTQSTAAAKGLVDKLNSLFVKASELINGQSSPVAAVGASPSASDVSSHSDEEEVNPLREGDNGTDGGRASAKQSASTTLPASPSPSSDVFEDEYRDLVVSACLKAMCLVASVDNSLKEAEVQFIAGNIVERGGGVEPSELRERIIVTCKQLASTGYAEAARQLVGELLPHKGRPLANLVLELMQSVAGVDGRMGNRERQVVDFFRRSIGGGSAR